MRNKVGQKLLEILLLVVLGIALTACFAALRGPQSTNLDSASHDTFLDSASHDTLPKRTLTREALTETTPVESAQVSNSQPARQQSNTPFLTSTPLAPPIQQVGRATSVPVNAPAPAITLTNFSHEWQTWNNCGPATLAMNLSFFGSTLNQADIGAILRQHEDDKNVGPHELVAFAQQYGYSAQLRVNGNSRLLKTLLSNDIPVLIETWLEPDVDDGLGHYRLLTGYDDVAQTWIAFDSYVSDNLIGDGAEYQGIILPYAETDELWQVFNRTYLLIYTQDKAAAVEAILGGQFDPQMMWNQALIDARIELDREPHNPFAWFNLGSTMSTLGNYSEAAAAFDQARQLGLPWRMLWYQFAPFEAYYQMQRYSDVIDLANATIATTTSVEEIYYWKGQGLAAIGDVEGARQAWQQSLALNPTYQDAIYALQSIQQ